MAGGITGQQGETEEHGYNELHIALFMIVATNVGLYLFSKMVYTRIR